MCFYSVLERSKLSLFSCNNGFNRLHPVNTLVRRECNLYILWDRFKYIGDSQLLEIVTTSKEIMPFHDHGVVVFWFGRYRNGLPSITALAYWLVKGGLWFVTKDENVSTSCCRIFCICSQRTSRDEHRYLVAGSVSSDFSSHISNQT